MYKRGFGSVFMIEFAHLLEIDRGSPVVPILLNYLNVDRIERNH